MNIDTYIQYLLEMDVVRKPVLRSAIQALGLPKGSSGLDAGCGIGLQCLLLAAETGDTGHVTGLDISEEMLRYGAMMTDTAGLSGQVTFQQGDITKLPFPDSTFDWVWSSDCAGYAPMDPCSLMEELKRVVKPGGIAAIAAWSSEILLPGYPRLESLLRSTSAGIAPFIEGKDPSLHFMRALGWFERVGLIDTKAETFARSVHAPLDEETHNALSDLISMRWPDASSELSGKDADEFDRLCNPESPGYVLDLPDYHAIFTYTMFRGIKPE